MPSTSRPGPKLYHLVTEDYFTLTFTMKDEMEEFAKGISHESHYVLCESEVSGEDYDRVSAWRGAVD